MSDTPSWITDPLPPLWVQMYLTPVIEAAEHGRGKSDFIFAHIRREHWSKDNAERSGQFGMQVFTVPAGMIEEVVAVIEKARQKMAAEQARSEARKAARAGRKELADSTRGEGAKA